MSNQVGDCFKFLWPFQNVRTLQISSSLLAKNVSSFTRFLQYPQTDLYQFFALSKRYIKEELSLTKK